jgi:hypothetical protein
LGVQHVFVGAELTKDVEVGLGLLFWGQFKQRYQLIEQIMNRLLTLLFLIFQTCKGIFHVTDEIVNAFIDVLRASLGEFLSKDPLKSSI